MEIMHMNEIHEEMRVSEMIVVEGRDDTSAILAAVDAMTIETHGYGIRKETWELLEKAYESKGLIIFTDPDPAGERIRRTLTEKFPKAKHAFLDRDDASSNGDVGIENASPKAIRAALSKVRSEVEDGDNKTPFTVSDMDRWGLAGGPGSSQLRRALGKELGIGFAGAKTFLKRLNHFGVDRRDVEEALGRITR